MTAPDGTVGHAEILISAPADHALGRVGRRGRVRTQHRRWHAGRDPRVRARRRRVVAQATASAGATLLRAVEDMPYGDRTGTIRDPYGHRWMVATSKERVPKPLLRKRFGEAFTIS